MPAFKYVAIGRNGKSEKGSLTANSRNELTEMLKSRGLTVDQKSIKEKGVGSLKAFTGKKVKTQEVLIFTRQLAVMVNAGLPLLQSLDILAEQSETAHFAEIIADIANSVEGGETLSDALRAYPRAFPDLFVSMVRSGEASGELDSVLIQLADFMEATAELKRKIRGAMTYPVAAFCIVIMIAAGLIVFVVPQFEKIFNDMGAQLPAPTRILIEVSDWLRSSKILILFGIVFATIVAVRAYNQTETGRYNLDNLKLKVPVFGMLLRKVAVSRFTGTLATLTRSGVPILQALEIVETTSGNVVFAKMIREAAEGVRNGESLAEPLARSGEFPPMVTRMIGVGEKTGALETMLFKIQEFYDSEVNALVDNMTSMLEPILLLMMGVVVGGIIIALFLPIMNLSSIIS
jgi:type IV pilus assembly protein PilC